MTPAAWIIVVAFLCLISFVVGYYVAKPYWYERGHFDGLDAADRYAKSRSRAQMASYPRIGPVERG